MKILKVDCRVSLKSKLGVMDLHHLIYDVRRRVEYEVTFEGLERRIKYASTPSDSLSRWLTQPRRSHRSPCCLSSFMSTLLPPTPDSMQRILVQGGIPQMSAMRGSPAFDRLLEETRSLLQSPDFSIVLESCLDRATDMLFKSVKDTIFVQAGSSVDETGAPLQLRLAGLLPGMARWSHLAFNGLPNELVDVRTLCRFLQPRAYGLLLPQQLADIREVEGFSAIIYSKFESQFV